MMKDVAMNGYWYGLPDDLMIAAATSGALALLGAILLATTAQPQINMAALYLIGVFLPLGAFAFALAWDVRLPARRR